MKKTYELNGKTFNTLTAMAKELGISRLYPKNFEKYGIKEVGEVEEINALIETTETTETTDAVTELEKDVVDLNIDEFSARLKKVDTEGLIKMAVNAGVNTWENMTNIGIRRMRLIMELKAIYYPESVKKSLKPSTGKSEWIAIPTEKLIESAKEKGAEYKETENEGIKRMRVIMALKAIGVTAESFK